MNEELKEAMLESGPLNVAISDPLGECFIYNKTAIDRLLKEATEQQECRIVVIPQTPFIERFSLAEQVLLTALIASTVSLGFVLGRLLK